MAHYGRLGLSATKYGTRPRRERDRESEFPTLSTWRRATRARSVGGLWLAPFRVSSPPSAGLYSPRMYKTWGPAVALIGHLVTLVHRLHLTCTTMYPTSSGPSTPTMFRSGDPAIVFSQGLRAPSNAQGTHTAPRPLAPSQYLPAAVNGPQPTAPESAYSFNYPPLPQHQANAGWCPSSPLRSGRVPPPAPPPTPAPIQLKATAPAFIPHAELERRKRIPCVHFQRHKGWCPYAEKCHFMHDWSIVSRPDSTASRNSSLGSTVSSNGHASRAGTFELRRGSPVEVAYKTNVPRAIGGTVYFPVKVGDERVGFVMPNGLKLASLRYT
ncbi:hypothetical protein BC834DRAFT_897216 [Gloeopeniophorella convolvens]|nr:hypothetical protein BC834DRAFT_897216 [Gloeopeniophorella convolvens]